MSSRWSLRIGMAPEPETLALRELSWRASDGAVENPDGGIQWTDACDEGAAVTHWSVWRDEALVACLRLHVWGSRAEVDYPRYSEALLVAERGGLGVSGRLASLSRLVVRPDARGQGVAARLLRAVEAELRARGGGLALIWTKRPFLIDWHLREGWVVAGHMLADFSRVGEAEQTTVMALEVSEA